MSWSAPSAPAAPDPNATAAAQTGSNIQTAVANARLNRVNQTTPWGSITYQQGEPDANGVPTYSSSINLSPQQQALLDQQQAQTLQRGTIAGDLLGRVGERLGQPLDLSRAHSIYDRGMGGRPTQYTGAVNQPNMLNANPGTGLSPGQVPQGIQDMWRRPGSAPPPGQVPPPATGPSVGGMTNPNAQAIPPGGQPGTGQPVGGGGSSGLQMDKLQQALAQNPNMRAQLLKMLQGG